MNVDSDNVIETDCCETNTARAPTCADWQPRLQSVEDTRETETDASFVFPQKTRADERNAEVISADARRQRKCESTGRTKRVYLGTSCVSAMDSDELAQDFEEIDIYGSSSKIEEHQPATTQSETTAISARCRDGLYSTQRHGSVLGGSFVTDKTRCCHDTQSLTKCNFWQNDDGDTLLHVALIAEDWHALALLVKTATPCLLNVQNKLRQTPLHLAVIVDKSDLVELMLQHGACATVQDLLGNTPLHIACKRDLRDCVEAMTSTMPFPTSVVDVMNYDGETVLHVAATEGHLDIFRFLLQPPLLANVNTRDGRSGRTVLHHAVESRNMPVLMQLLLTPGVWLDAVTYDGQTPLALAEGRGYGDVADLLVVAGADPMSGWVDSDVDNADACNSEDEDSVFDDFFICGRPINNASMTAVPRISHSLTASG